MVEFQVDRTIAASPERVFDWLADPANLTAAPVILKVRWVKVGALREAIGLGGWFREQITAHDRPRAYSYRVVRSSVHLRQSVWHGTQCTGGATPLSYELFLAWQPARCRTNIHQ